MSSKKSLDLIRSISDFVTKSGGFESVLKHVSKTNGHFLYLPSTKKPPFYRTQITITAAGDGKCTAEFKVQPEHLNRGGGLHGGFTATVVDNYTTFALMSNDKPAGVSVDLHVSYLKAAKLGDEVLIDASTVRAGKRLAFLACELRQKADGSLIARGTQTKFIGS